MTSDEKPKDTKVERDHPQTRKGEPDARGSSQWRKDIEPPSDKTEREEGKHGSTVGDLAEEAESVRSDVLGNRARDAFGSDRASDE